MKDYTFDKQAQEKFIKNYKIKDGKIIINLASKEKYIIPYTKENEAKILSIMEEQVNKANIKPSVLAKILLTCSSILLLFAFYACIVGGSFSCLILSSFLTISSSAYMYINHAKVKDLEKQRFFLDNRKLFNDNIKKSSNITLGLEKKTVKKIKSSENETVFDINTIDSYTLDELKKIRRNIMRFYEFGFEESENLEQEKRLKFHK